MLDKKCFKYNIWTIPLTSVPSRLFSQPRTRTGPARGRQQDSTYLNGHQSALQVVNQALVLATSEAESGGNKKEGSHDEEGYGVEKLVRAVEKLWRFVLLPV